MKMANEDDEISAAQINITLDDETLSYERDYLSNPGTSIFMLEKRHVKQVLRDKSIPFYYRID